MNCIQCGREFGYSQLSQGICEECLNQLMIEEDAHEAMEIARSEAEERARQEAEEAERIARDRY